MKFHNGDTVTAEDVVWSIERCAAATETGIVQVEAFSVIEAIEATDEHTGAYLEPSARGIAERVARLWDELSFPRIDLVDHVDVTVDRGIASAPTDWVAPAYAGGRRAAELISRAAGDL